jgi:DNA-directed RNA polymerase specialized sigma24 family protein
MAARKPRARSTQEPANIEPTEQLERLTNLVALLLVKGESQSEKIRTLAAVGYSAPEIAHLLGTTANAVNVALHRIRQKKG